MKLSHQQAIVKHLCDDYTVRQEGSKYLKNLPSPVTLPPHFREMYSPSFFLQLFLFLAAALQFRIWNKSTASVRTASSHLILGLPTDFFLRMPFENLRESSVFDTWPNRCSPFRLKVLTLQQHHEPCNFIVGYTDTYPLGLKASEYLPEEFPSNRLNHIDI